MTKPRNERLWDAIGQFALTLYEEELTEEQAEQACKHAMDIFRGRQRPPQMTNEEWEADLRRKCDALIARMESDMAGVRRD
jgi:hypothetical protein